MELGDWRLESADKEIGGGGYQLTEEIAMQLALLDQVSDAVIVSDSNHKVRIWNHSAELLFGWSPEEIIGTHGVNLLQVEFPNDMNLGNIDQILAEKGEYKGDVTMARKDGKRFPVELGSRVLHGGSGQFLGYISLCRDISERKSAEEKLSHFAALVESSSDIIISKTLDGIITNWNKGAEEIYGYTAAEVIGKPISILLPPGFEDDMDQILKTIRSGLKVSHFETIRRTKDGACIPVSLTVSPIINQKGTIMGVSTIGRDISERKRFEKEIQSKNEELAKANAQKDRYFSVLAHDLRSPFTSLLGLTQILVEELPQMDPEEAHKLAISTWNSATKVYSLLENLLEWSKMERGSTQFCPDKIRLLSVMADSLSLIHETADNKHVALSIDFPEDLIVYADENMLQSIIRNLLFNAIKFTSSGGQVTASAHSTGNLGIDLIIQDTGIGMSSAMVETLFSLENRNNRPGTNGEPSSGLGLLLCYEFVSKHEGTLSVVSEPGKGSTFTVHLPGLPPEA